MRWYISYPILAAGLAFGFDTFFPGSPDFSSTKAQALRSAEPAAWSAEPLFCPRIIMNIINPIATGQASTASV